MTLVWGGFFVFLGSGQPIIDEIYGRGDWFAGYFAITAFFIAAASWTAGRFSERIGAHRVVLIGIGTVIVLAATMTIAAVATDGRPPFWVWFVLVTGTSAGSTIATPAFSALALQPMQRLAGTASAVMGLCATGGGALLAALVDRRIDDTVTPMGVGMLVYATGALALTLWARGGSLAPVDPDAVASAA